MYIKNKLICKFEVPKSWLFQPKFRIRQLRNRFTTVINGFYKKPLETIRTSGLTLIISISRFFKTYTELHLTKSQQDEYQILVNILIRDYLNFNTTNS